MFQKTLYAAMLSLMSVNAYAEKDNDSRQIEDIEVTAKKTHPSAESLFDGTSSTLDEKALKRERAQTLGDTVNKISGVQSSSFGPTTGTPMIRSYLGERVQLLGNGMDLSDVSFTGGNLPAVVNPFLAESIAVQKSSATVLYGGRAIGGAVNVEDKRIPQRLPEKNFGGKVDVNAGDNNGNTQLFSLDGSNGKNWAWHLDGFRRHVSSYNIPGKSKAGICYNADVVVKDTTLRDLCQVKVSRGERLNPGLFPYLNKFILDNPEYESEMPYGKYTMNKGYGKNPPNPLYDPNVKEAKTVVATSPATDIVPTEDGKITNSHLRQNSIAFGTSYIGENGFVGIGISRDLLEYGVPGFASIYTRTEDTHKPAANGKLPANIRAQQTRIYLDTRWDNPVSFLNNIRFKAAHTDTGNSEYLGDIFSSRLNAKMLQTRVELNQKSWRIWDGSMGFDWKYRKTKTHGVDRYMPNVDTHEYGVFLLERLRYKGLTAEAGGRWEKVSHAVSLDTYKPGRGASEKYPASHSYPLQDYYFALKWQPVDAWHIKVQRHLSERAPEIHQLYASNRHFATLTHEYGTDKLNPEKARTWELNTGFDFKDFRFNINWYRTQFADYMYLQNTSFDYGDSLPVKRWEQSNTLVHGIEAEINHHLPIRRFGQWDIRIFGDWVKNKPTDNTNKRQLNNGMYMIGLPTSRYGLGLDWSMGRWQASTSATRYTRQKHLGNYIARGEEHSFSGYTLWDAYLSYRQPVGQNTAVEYYLDGRNLSNTEARPHQSALKYLAPLPGRSVTAGVRLSF